MFTVVTRREMFLSSDSEINTITCVVFMLSYMLNLNHDWFYDNRKMETRRKRNAASSEAGSKSKRPKKRNEISLTDSKDISQAGLNFSQ